MVGTFAAFPSGIHLLPLRELRFLELEFRPPALRLTPQRQQTRRRHSDASERERARVETGVYPAVVFRVTGMTLGLDRAWVFDSSPQPPEDSHTDNRVRGPPIVIKHLPAVSAVPNNFAIRQEMINSFDLQERICYQPPANEPLCMPENS